MPKYILAILALIIFISTSFQAKELQIKRVATDKKVVALTFDDGPGKYTTAILKILKNKNVKATFFLVGNIAERKANLAFSIKEQGHEIGNHSYSHPLFRDLSIQQTNQEITKSQSVFFNIFDECPRLMRPSYGKCAFRVTRELDKYFDHIVLWSVESLDYRRYMTPQKISKQVVLNIEPGAIVLLHETYERTLKALPKIINMLQAKGYKIVTLSELFKYGDTLTK